MMISVVIPTRNRAELLALALNSIVAQDLAKCEFEILVIDNGSTDHTSAIVNDFKDKFPNVKGIYAPEPGLHVGRHIGMIASQGDILVFADDDIEAMPTWLPSIQGCFRDSSVAMVCGNNYPYFLQPPPEWLAKIWNKSYSHGYKSIPSLSVIEFLSAPKRVSPYLIWGCNFPIRKKVLLDAGGFHPDGMPIELIQFRGDGETHVSKYVAELGLKCVFNSGASVKHKVTAERMTYQYFRQRAFNQGISDSYTQLRQGILSVGIREQPYFKRLVGSIVGKISGIFDGEEVVRVAKELEIGYREGFDYHQKSYLDDSKVREWVHQKNYF